MTSVKAYKLVDNFEIESLDSLFSDGHTVVNCTIIIPNTNFDTHNQSVSDTKAKWEPSLQQTFVENINTCTQIVQNEILRLKIQSQVTQEEMDSLSDKLSKVFIQSADATFPKHKRTYRKTTKHQWYGTDCRNAKTLYNKARKRYSKYPSGQNKLLLNTTCKKYKCIMNIYINKYNKENENKLRNMNKNNPKGYWRFINKLNAKPKVNGPDLQELYNYFKNSNQKEDDDELNEDDQDENNIFIDENTLSTLNADFTAAEINKCIQQLKK